jgi:hypothetical protein
MNSLCSIAGSKSHVIAIVIVMHVQWKNGKTYKCLFHNYHSANLTALGSAYGPWI